MNGKIFLISGFLGSGKTAFALELIKRLSTKEIRVALIVNEVGEIGIDNQYMKQLGHNVWEIFGGCICCSLSTGLESTLTELENNFKPNVIIIEPSGAADPKAIYEVLLGLNFEKEKINNFFILDPTRIEMFEEILSPLLYSSLNFASSVIVNKLDLADETAISKCKRLIEEHAVSPEQHFFTLGNPFSAEFEKYILKLLIEKR